MFADFLRALGRGVVAILAALFLPALEQVGHALARLVRMVVVAAVLGGTAWWFIVNRPDVANAVLQIVIFCGVVYVGFRVLLGAGKRGGGAQRRRQGDRH